ncbi:hypothetical protein, partial [Escherichia coli]|uniref:hypothetical protein n=1 Tax=Escherichia coli TaxID=562 RepID=UPI001A7E0989
RRAESSTATVYQYDNGLLNFLGIPQELTQGFIYTLIVYSGTKGQRDPIGIHQSTQVLAVNITVFLTTREGMWKLVN